MRAPALRLVDGPTAEPQAVGTGWLEWLAANSDPRWRPAEWDRERWLFSGDLDNERTLAWRCRTPSCPTPTRRRNARCSSCVKAQAAAGLDDEAFDREPLRRRALVLPRGTCSVPGCERDLYSSGLCHQHDDAWQHRRARDGSFEEFLNQASPLRRLDRCRVTGCPRERISGRGLCNFHYRRLWREGPIGSRSEADVDRWVEAQRPLLGAHQFSLAGLCELVRVEVLYALQRRDEAPPPLSPTQVRILVERLAGAASIRHLDVERVCVSGGMSNNSEAKGLLRDLRRVLERAWVLHTGADPWAGDVWQVCLLDLHSNGSRRYPATQGVVDLGMIEHAWLRAVVKEWARTTRPFLYILRETIRASRIASQALSASGHTDPARLGAGDFTRIVDAISDHRRTDGSLYSATHRNRLLHLFFVVVDFGRTSGVMAEVPDPFCRAGHHHLVSEEANEEGLGRALPETVIRQLDAHLDLLGPMGRAGPLRRDDLQAMHQTIYRLLRDTGRRPGEVVSLKLGCIEVIDGHHNLIYDNLKQRRMRRRLPITTDTARTVLAWEARRAELPTPVAASRWLFPSPMLKSKQSLGHVTSNCVGRAFRAWVERIPRIDGELLGVDGQPARFEPSLVIPYALRHSWAQRHADAGVPVDVLKELMDHRSVQTTMGYYRVSLRRKQQAIRSVGSLAVDADGNPTPFDSPLAYERASVSVPFGNCTEPSNVKAGGGSCPIRFQCAGCGFYRPDPSYLPAIEEHIASLRADRETARAMAAADYVLANLTAEIDAFARVAERMRGRLAELGADERAEVEDASRMLRRARAARRIPVVAITSGAH